LKVRKLLAISRRFNDITERRATDACPQVKRQQYTVTHTHAHARANATPTITPFRSLRNFVLLSVYTGGSFLARACVIKNATFEPLRLGNA
jgi:hypothetical protein